MKKIKPIIAVTTQHGFVKHAGVVTKLSKDSVMVTLTGNLNCTTCHAKTACGVSEVESKTIEVFDYLNSFKLNENIDVMMGNDKGLKAVLFAYIFPFILLFLTLIISLNFLKEWQAGLLSLVVLVPYYILLYFLTPVFVQTFKVNLIKKQQ